MLFRGTTASRITIRRLFSRLLAALFCLATLANADRAWAIYTVVYNGTVTHLATGVNSTPSVTNPSGVALDVLGNLYVADTGGNRIVEVSAGGSTSVLSISGLSQALSAPQQLAVDGVGNLYIADTGNNRIVEVDTSGNGTVISTPSVTLSGPRGVAVDVSGNIFITDTSNSRVVKVTAGGTASVLATSSGVALTSLSSPEGIATDSFGNVYIADTGNNRVVKVTPALVGSNISSGISSPALNAPVAVTVGSNGNVYIVDGPTNQRVAIVDPQGDLYDLLFDNANSEFGVPSAIAQSPNGTFYIADTEDDEVNAFQVNTAGFGHVALGSSATPLTLNFNVGFYTTLTSVAVYTSGTPTPDFTIAANDGTPCTTGSGGLVSCTVNVQFTPTMAGLRRGALVLSYTDMFLGAGSHTVPIFGIGDAPVATLSPGVASVLNVGSVSIGEPFQTAFDGAGNIYVTSYSNSTVLKIPAGGGSGSVVTIPALPSPTGLQEPTGLAIDGAGNLFIADYLHNRIVEVTPDGTSKVITIRGLSGGLSLPTALAFDGYGHLFVNDYGHGRIVLLTPDPSVGDGTAGVTVGYVYAIGGYTLGSDNSTGIAVDNIGNIYAPDEGNNRVIKVDSLGNESTVSLTGAGNLSGPLGVAIDPSGNLYVMDSGNERIIQKTTTGSVSVMKYTGPSLGSFVFGITVDGGGNVLLSDFVNNRLVLDNVGQSVLAFPSTKQFSNSATQTTTITNLGDQPLVFSANPTYTPSFSQDTTDDNSCISETSLASGQICDVPIIFSPQSIGSLSANIAVTDNTQNIPGATQIIAVSGTSINPGDTTSTTVVFSPTSSSYSYGQALAITANIADTTTGHTAIIPTGSATFTDTFGMTVTQVGSAVTLNSSGSATVSNVVLAGIGSHSITANYSGVTGSYLSSTKTTAITLSQAEVTLSGPTTLPISVVVGQAGSVAITATPAYTGGTMPTGSVSFSITNSSNTSVSSGTAPLTAGSGVSTATVPVPSNLPAGSYVITLTYDGDTNYQSATGITLSLTIGQDTPVISWTVPSSIAYGANLSGVLTATASFGNASLPGTFTYTVTSSGLTPTAVTSATTLDAGTYTVTAIFTPAATTTYSIVTRSATFTVSQIAPSVTLLSSLNPAVVTASIVFTATVNSSVGTPSGTISFLDGSTPLGAVPLANGQAAFTTSSLASGTHSITAAYSGDRDFSAGTSTAVGELVQDFTVSTPISPGTNAPTQTVTPGGTATYTLNIGPSAGTVFPAPVTLSLTGLPPGATGVLSPTTLPAGSSLSNVTLTIQLPQETSRMDGTSHTLRAVSPIVLGLLILPFARKWRRAGKRLRGTPVILVLLIGIAATLTGLAGCSPGNGFFAHALTQYTVRIIATCENVSHSTQVTLIVE